GMLPFSMALQRTGGVDRMADGMMALLGGAGAHAVLASLFAITALLGLFISNTATAVLMAPVALAIAKDLDASPYSFAMTVALAASTAFMTPVSSPVNTLVVTRATIPSATSCASASPSVRSPWSCVSSWCPGC